MDEYGSTTIRSRLGGPKATGNNLIDSSCALLFILEIYSVPNSMSRSILVEPRGKFLADNPHVVFVIYVFPQSLYSFTVIGGVLNSVEFLMVSAGQRHHQPVMRPWLVVIQPENESGCVLMWGKIRAKQMAASA